MATERRAITQAEIVLRPQLKSPGGRRTPTSHNAGAGTSGRGDQEDPTAGGATMLPVWPAPWGPL